MAEYDIRERIKEIMDRIDEEHKKAISRLNQLRKKAEEVIRELGGGR